VEYALRIPSELKYKRRKSKYILKKLANRYLPINIVNRTKKGFGIPISKWIKRDLKNDFMDTFNSNENWNYIFKKDYINNLFNSHINNQIDNRKLLWSLFVFMKWQER
jgi:asparagine synthase (glutamine-hydrolysing)